MPTDTQVNDLKINVLSEAQYEQIASPSSTELYLVPETVDTTPTSGSTNPITSGGVYNALQNIPEQEQSDWNENDATDPAYIKNKPQNIVTDASYVHTDNNYTTTEKNKLAGIESGAEVNVQSDWNQTNSSADDFIKNKPDLDATLYEEITYSQLVTKTNNSQLVKGKKYRITDYVTTTRSEQNNDDPSINTFKYKSAKHQFDLVVTATSTSALDRVAKAVPHEGDSYFSSEDLNRLTIWYALFGGEVTYDSNYYGTGFIYRMVDTTNNIDCPYDFKNIMFRRKLTNGSLDSQSGTWTWVYTFDNGYGNDRSKSCGNNVIKPYIINDEGGDKLLLEDGNVFLGGGWYNNSIGHGSYNNTICSGCTNISIGDDCLGIEFNNLLNGAIVENWCYNLKFSGTSQNVYVAQGVHSADIVLSANAAYRTTVGRDSSGNIRIYNEDDPQVQANWNETNSSSPSYIQNKPTIPTVPTHRTVNHEQITDSSLGDINLHDGFYFPNAVQDYDGNWYGAVVIGDQVWLGENLRTTHYVDGTAIANGGSSTSDTTAYYYNYANSMIPFEKRGLLYNYPATINIIPTGWSLPTKNDYQKLTNYVSSQKRFIIDNDSSAIAKALASTSYWDSSDVENAIGNNISLNNATGLNLVPSGYLINSLSGILTHAILWTKTNKDSNNFYAFAIENNNSNTFEYNYLKNRALSVRCVSNLTPLQFRDWYVNQYGTLQHKLDELPSMSGNSGKVLAVNSTETDVEWVSTQECMWYGVRKDRSNDSTTLERIGNLEMHKTLPIQSKMRRCLLLDNGTVNYYLSDTDSTKKEDGVTAAVLDGTDGQVMVEIPAHYQRFDIYTDEVTGHEIEERKISEVALPGFEYVPARYYSAFEAALDRTNNKLSSVINTSAQYRGGNNTNWDGTYRSLLGMPATSISLTNFRTYAHNRGTGWQCHDNNIYEIVCNLYIIEYANTNCQLAFNASPIASGNWAGCKQGGLGSGVTGMPDWSAYNSYNPVVPCGVTVTLGNATGVVTYNVIASDGSTVKYAAPVPSYHGIENLFGHIWKHTDAILVNIQSAGAGGKSMVYKCTDPTKYSSTLTADYVYVGDEARSQGWTKNVLTPCMVCSEVGADSSTGYADYHYTSIPSSGSSLRAVVSGGGASSGASAGFAYSLSFYDPSYTYAGIGSRLCYTPMTVELPPLEGNGGKVLAVNSGENGVDWVRPVTVYSGSSEPSASLGEDGDIFILAS